MRLCMPLYTLLLCLSAAVQPLAAQPLEYANRVELESKVYGQNRTIRISLPTTYANNSQIRYPVIYVARGQLDLLSTVASLNLLDSEVPEFITVGVDGGLGDFFPSKDGSKTQYGRLLHDEILPYIEKNYRTAPYKILVGHSMAAIFVTNEWLTEGSQFSKYVVISPPLANPRFNKEIESKKKSDLKANSPILISIANEGKLVQKRFAELQQILSNNDAATFKTFPEQTHMSTRTNTVMHALREEFPDWQPPKELEEGAFSEIKKYYQMLSERYGFEAQIPLDTLARMSGLNSWNDDEKKNANAQAIVKYTLARNNNDAQKLFEVAGQLTDFGATLGSERLVSYICNEVPKHSRCNKQ